MVSKLNGSWKMVSSENFEEYMKALGVNSLVRKLVRFVKPKAIMSLNGDDFSYKSVSSLRTMETKCKLGEEFQEDIPDGRKTKSVIILDGERLIHTQRWEDKHTTITRYVDETDHFIMEFVFESVTSRRIYQRI